MLTFEKLIEPLSLDDFYNIYHKKRWCVINGNNFRKDLFSKIITWQKFSRYINNDRAVSGLQAILPDGRKLCMEKWNLYKSKKPTWCKEHYYEKKFLHDIWTNHGSIILTKASLFTPEISSIAGAIENHFGGAADAHFYCSYSEKSNSFKEHADLDDNFLVHANGSVRWIVYNSLENKEGDTTEIDLTVGDLLYIPKGLQHKAIPLSKRISISVPLNKGITAKPLDRTVYDFS
jgi:mannose-6-phosphate isomerase-like protein (cupin superfamily)|tara:strand:- start:1076 stop:1774 length:699 start_codon:yes stop_codon:yes gene_type:complete